jgi:hypothetical protein
VKSPCKHYVSGLNRISSNIIGISITENTSNVNDYIAYTNTIEHYQAIEKGTENPRVSGSIPLPGISSFKIDSHTYKTFS